jgi:hypothetical protein
MRLSLGKYGAGGTTSLLFLVLSACAALPPDAPVRRNTDSYLQAEHGDNRSFQIGVALSGGGQKSAPFEMGVLAALSQTGALSNIDVISSVSGGSYAALFYYTRIAEYYQYYTDASPWAGSSPFDEVFLDCLPQQLSTDVVDHYSWMRSDSTGLCPDSHPLRNYWLPNDAELNDDPLRFASQVRSTQALFATGWFIRPGWSYKDKTKWPWNYQSYGQELGLGIFNSLVLLPLHAISDNVFDWNFEVAPGKWAYNHGIRRTYGTTASIEPQHSMGRSEGSRDTVDRLSFSDLQQIYLDSHKSDCSASPTHPCNLPLWVINTTAGTSDSPFLLTSPATFDAAHNTFELSPFGFGSGAYGYARWNEPSVEGVTPPLTVADAVGASAAFFDSQQRTYSQYFGTAFWNVLMRFFNFDWGSSIPNYNLGAPLYDEAAALHVLLPWPLYLLHRHQGNENALRIHLSDGGMSEDLGVWSLLRRHISQIIVVDAASDDHYQLDDLCHLQTQLRNLQEPWEPRRIVFESPRLSRFEDICKLEQSGKAARDPFHFRSHGDWPAPVLKAWICNARDRTCTANNAVATLYIVKPMLNWTARPPAGYALNETLALNGNPIAQRRCSIPSDGTTVGAGYPCEVISYLATHGNCGSAFPQDSTVTVSALSSAYIYGAYRDLGIYYGKAIRINETDDHAHHVEIDLSSYWSPAETDGSLGCGTPPGGKAN